VEGLLFGLAYPLTGIDHLGGAAAAAAAAAMSGGSVRLPLLFGLASLAGVRLRGFGVDVPLAELLTALFVFGSGVLLVSGRSGPAAALVVAFGVAGLAHGCAYGEHIETAAAGAFLAAIVGLAVVQVAVVAGVIHVGHEYAARGPAPAAGFGRRVGGYVVMAGTIALLSALA
jgi:urease accessory protein